MSGVEPLAHGRVFIVARAASFAEGVGGMERVVADHARGLAKLGWDVVLCAPAARIRGSAPMPVLDVGWPRSGGRPGSPAFGFGYWIWTRKVARTLRGELRGGDAIYFHGGAAGVLQSRQPLPANVRAVANPHGMEEFKGASLLRTLARLIPRWLARGAAKADCVLATDTCLAPAVTRNLRVASDRVLVVPNGVDLSALAANAEAGRALVGRAPDIVSVGRLVHNKGYDLLAESLALVLKPEERGNLLWRHFGKGPEAHRVSSLATAIAGLHFELHENASDAEVQANLAATRVFVQPSRYEGSSLTTLEAMAQGAISVGTPVGGIPDKIQNRRTGFLAAEVSAHALASSISEALVASGEVSQAARNAVESKFGMAHIIDRLSSALAGDQTVPTEGAR